MNFEQIIIRLGVDGTAVKAGLGKVSSLVKAWGTSISHGLKEYMGSTMKGFLGAEVVEKAVEYLGEVKEKILEISRISEETGASTNFIQGLELDARKAGKTFQGMDMAIVRFNKLIGDAKFGSAEAIKKLYDLGIITKSSEARTLTFAGGMKNLAISFDKLTDKQKQSALLFEAFGKGFAAMSPVFEQGAKHIDDLSKGNFFTKMSSGAIKDFQTLWSSLKTASTATMASVVNTLDLPFAWIRTLSKGVGVLSNGVLPGTKRWKEDMESLNKQQEEVNEKNEIAAMAEKDQISVEEERSKILELQNTLLERQKELSSEINDRNKESVSEMAQRARRLTGIKGPLEMLHTVTPRMRTALRIESLEESAKVAFLQGRDEKIKRLQSEADQIRAANPWLKRSDVNPMEKTESQLKSITIMLGPVNRLAKAAIGSGGEGGS